jgi:hypothetical protein
MKIVRNVYTGAQMATPQGGASVAIGRRRCRPASRTPAWWFVIAPRVCPHNIEGIPDRHVVLISAGHTICGRPRVSVACANWRLGTTVCGAISRGIVKCTPLNVTKRQVSVVPY